MSIAPIFGNATVGINLYNEQMLPIGVSYGNYGTPQPLVQTLDAGKYFVLINDVAGDTNVQYRLDVSAQSLAANDGIGNDFAQAKDLGKLLPNFPFPSVSDAIGGTDSADWFRFNMGALGDLLPVLSGLTAPVSLQLLRIEANGSLTPISTVSSSGQSVWNPTFTNLPVGNYALALTSPSGTSTPYTLNLSSVSTNTAPSGLTVNLGGIYSSNQDIIVTGSVFDANGASDLDDVWISINGQTYFVKNFTPSPTDNRVANFSINIGKLPVGTYGWSASASDKSRQGSGVTLSNNSVQVVYAPVDTAGETPQTARDLGTVTQPILINEFVGTIDRTDVFQFTVPPTSRFDNLTSLSFQLDGLSGDADFSIYKILANGAKVSVNSPTYGTGTKAFTGAFLPGTYFVDVYTRDGTINTNYNFQIIPPSVGTIQVGQTVSGSLETTDGKIPGTNQFYDDYALNGLTANQPIRLTLSANGFSPQIFVLDNVGHVVSQSVVTTGNSTTLDYIAPYSGNYAIRVTSQGQNATGNYTLSTVAGNSSNSGNSSGNTGGSSLYPTFNLGKLTGS